MEARAEHKFARISPRKVKIVCDLIRDKDVELAKGILQNTPNSGAALLYKVLCSACANAENNHEMDPSKLYVSKVMVTGGPTMKRGRASARGPLRAYPEENQPHHRCCGGKGGLIYGTES